MLRKEILDHASKVYLMTRPRRFGKTLGLSMLRTFFEDARDKEGNKVDNLHYFDGKKLWRLERIIFLTQENIR